MSWDDTKVQQVKIPSKRDPQSNAFVSTFWGSVSSLEHGNVSSFDE